MRHLQSPNLPRHITGFCLNHPCYNAVIQIAHIFNAVRMGLPHGVVGNVHVVEHTALKTTARLLLVSLYISRTKAVFSVGNLVFAPLINVHLIKDAHRLCTVSPLQYFLACPVNLIDGGGISLYQPCDFFRGQPSTGAVVRHLLLIAL